MAFAGSDLALFYDGWAAHQRRVATRIGELTADQVGLRTAPEMWTIWQLAGHVAGSRSYWFQDVLGEGDPALRERFRMTTTTVPGLALEDAGWEDDENLPRTPAELVDALGRTWGMIENCLSRWSPDDLAIRFSRPRPSGSQTFTRAWVIWHVMEHDVHHAGEISQILGAHGLAGLDM